MIRFWILKNIFLGGTDFLWSEIYLIYFQKFLPDLSKAVLLFPAYHARLVAATI